MTRFMDKYSYSYFNAKEYSETEIKRNILDLDEARQSIYFDDNIFTGRSIKALDLYNSNSENNIIEFIKQNSINYIIDFDTTKIPECISLKKIDEIYSKSTIRNFLIKKINLKKTYLK